MLFVLNSLIKRRSITKSRDMKSDFFDRIWLKTRLIIRYSHPLPALSAVIGTLDAVADVDVPQPNSAGLT